MQWSQTLATRVPSMTVEIEHVNPMRFLHISLNLNTNGKIDCHVSCIYGYHAVYSIV